ncbi:MAG: hypothetical protein J6I96_06825 [Oscillospiraceae bacterium]|nr:hypothetical protein [Oscillospiraceae bacterium]
MIVLIVLGIILLVLIILLNIPVRVRAAYYDKKLSYDVKYALFTLINSDRDDSDDKDTDDTGADEKPPDTDKPEETESAQKPEQDVKDEEKAEDSKVEKDDGENADGNKKEDHGSDTGKDKKKKTKKHRSLIPREHLADKITAKAEELSDKIDAVKLVIDLVWDDLIKLIKKVYFTGLVVDLTAASEDAAEAAISYGRMNAVTYDAIATVKALTRLDVKSVSIDCLYDTPKDQSSYNGEITLRLRPASLVNALFAVLFRFLFHLKKYKPILDTFLKK